MKINYRSKTEIKRLERKSRRRSGIAKHWNDWDSVRVCDHCGRTRQEARIYHKKRIESYVWEQEPHEIHKRQKVEVDICEVCLAFVDERGYLP